MMAGAAAALLVTVEPGMGIAGMVEHAVEDHAHSRPLGVVAQPEQRREWQQNALAWAEVADIYSNAERAAEIIMQESA